ncbi:MAG: hypothetical protein R2819_09585 [Allomuricauda sp.]
MSSIGKVLVSLLCTLSFSFFSFSQIGETASARLEKFMEENSKITYTPLESEATQQILKDRVYCISLKTTNIYDDPATDLDEFIVIDNGQHVTSCKKMKDNTEMTEFLTHIREDFVLNDETAPLFENLLDVLYPVESWKPDKREFLQKNGKWYFLRDAYFRTKQGFEISVDQQGKVTAICYKMKWDSPDAY